jgi:hypothetical protein
LGDCRDMLRDGVVERWALRRRYGGVGRSLHGCGVCDQTKEELSDRMAVLARRRLCFFFRG